MRGKSDENNAIEQEDRVAIWENGEVDFTAIQVQAHREYLLELLPTIIFPPVAIFLCLGQGRRRRRLFAIVQVDSM